MVDRFSVKNWMTNDGQPNLYRKSIDPTGLFIRTEKNFCWRELRSGVVLCCAETKTQLIISSQQKFFFTVFDCDCDSDICGPCIWLNMAEWDCATTTSHYTYFQLHHDASYHSLSLANASFRPWREDGWKSAAGVKGPTPLKKRFLVAAERGLLLSAKEQKDATRRDLGRGSGVGEPRHLASLLMT